MVSSLDYSKLEGLATVGGYEIVTRLSNLTGVFLLSACWFLREKWIWQTPLLKITDTEYEQIIAMIEQAEYELMTSFSIGQVISTVSDMSGNDYLLPLDGATIDGNDYPELLAVVPASWVSGTDITLPDLSEKGVFGENGNVGDIVGENDVILSVGQMPSHTHIQNAHSHSYSLTSAIPTAAGLEPTFADLTTQVPSTTGATVATNQNSGNDESHNNIQSSLSVYWWIVAR